MSSPTLVIVRLDESDGPGHLADVLERRNRDFVVLDPTHDPPPVDEVRGVGVLGTRGAVPAVPEALSAWLRSCQDGGVPILAMSEGCQSLVSGEPPTQSEPAMVRVDFMPDSADDEVFGQVPPGSLWPLTAPALPEPEEGTAVVLVGEDGSAVASRRAEPTYLTRLAPYRRAEDLAEQLPQLAETIMAGERFIDALSVSLLGRWVDVTVGRTEEEMPWGRKGPSPVAAAGLSLNPLPGG